MAKGILQKGNRFGTGTGVLIPKTCQCAIISIFLNRLAREAVKDRWRVRSKTCLKAKCITAFVRRMHAFQLVTEGICSI